MFFVKNRDMRLPWIAQDKSLTVQEFYGMMKNALLWYVGAYYKPLYHSAYKNGRVFLKIVLDKE